MGIDQVHDREKGVFGQHPRTGIAHDLAHPLSWLGPIAVDRTIGARRLDTSVWAEVEPRVGIGSQLEAFRTEIAIGVVIGAVHFHHRPHRSPFPPQPLVSFIHDPMIVQPGRDCNDSGQSNFDFNEQV